MRGGARPPESFPGLPIGRGGRVGRSEPHSNGALPQSLVNLADHLGDLARGRDLVCRIAIRQKSAGIMHDRNPYRDVADADTVVDGSPWFSVAIPRIDVCGANLELEGRGNAIQHLASVGFVGLLVRMQIDETGC